MPIANYLSSSALIQQALCSVLGSDPKKFSWTNNQMPAAEWLQSKLNNPQSRAEFVPLYEKSIFKSILPQSIAQYFYPTDHFSHNDINIFTHPEIVSYKYEGASFKMQKIAELNVSNYCFELIKDITDFTTNTLLVVFDRDTNKHVFLDLKLGSGDANLLVTFKTLAQNLIVADQAHKAVVETELCMDAPSTLPYEVRTILSEMLRTTEIEKRNKLLAKS